MRHNYIDQPNQQSGHWAASTNGYGLVLAQIGDPDGSQSRVSLTPAQAREFAAELVRKANEAQLQDDWETVKRRPRWCTLVAQWLS